MSIYEAAMRYQADGVPLVVIAGKEYGTGSSRDWAAKGTSLLGVRAVICQSYERIHRSNLVGMGVLPLEFADGQIARVARPDRRRSVRDRGHRGRAIAAQAPAASTPTRRQFDVIARVDTPQEIEYYLHGGILQYVLRQMAQ